MPLFLLFFCILLSVPVVWPQADMVVSGLFYRAGEKFFLVDAPVFVAAHWLATDGARVLVAFLIAAGVIAWWRKKPCVGVTAKGWAFLLVALLVGPGLVANAGFKDNWGRARPREIVEFGGAQPFTPALEAHFERARPNGSFVAGDGAFGFFLPAFAFVVPRSRSRRVFWGTMAAGGFFGFTRIAMGAHFFSDVVWAAAFMLVVSTALHAAMYGRAATRDYWRLWLGNGRP